jgi:radical SAM superfamily enzyme YgiQ (UPF0313 family)
MTKKVVLFNGVDGIRHQAVPKPWAPLSVLMIGSFLSSHGYEPVIIDPQLDEDWRTTLEAAVSAGAVYVGVTCMTGPSVRNVLDAIELTRLADPKTPIVWGGYHATLRFSAIIREGLVDVVVRGPGEPAALALAQIYERQRRGDDLSAQLAEIPNIAFRAPPGGRTEVAITRTERIFDVNDLPPCDYDLLPPDQYYTADERKVPYVSSYGCPHACAYCSEPTTSGRRWRGLSPERIVSDARRLVDSYEPDILDFMDPNFSSDPRRVVAFVKELERYPVPLMFMGNMRSRDIVFIMKHLSLKQLAAVGFRRVFMGVESGSDRVLDFVNKNSTTDDTLRACTALAEAGIETWTSFMHDLPTENDSESEQTLQLAEQLMHLDGNYQSHHFYMPFPDTKLFDIQFDNLDLDALSQRDWAESSTKGSSLWEGRPEFRQRVSSRLRQLQAVRPRVFSLTDIPCP